MLFEADYAKNYASIMYQCLSVAELFNLSFRTATFPKLMEKNPRCPHPQKGQLKRSWDLPSYSASPNTKQFTLKESIVIVSSRG